jgi:hypothetical protein
MWALALVVALFFVTDLLPAVGSPSRDAVEESLAEELDGSTSLSDEGCLEIRGSTVLRCEIADRSRSSAARYRVERQGRRCWEAERITRWGEGEGTTFYARVEGCVSLREQFLN